VPVHTVCAEAAEGSKKAVAATDATNDALLSSAARTIDPVTLLSPVGGEELKRGLSQAAEGRSPELFRIRGHRPWLAIARN
jgi:hypothetical protein